MGPARRTSEYDTFAGSSWAAPAGEARAGDLGGERSRREPQVIAAAKWPYPATCASRARCQVPSSPDAGSGGGRSPCGSTPGTATLTGVPPKKRTSGQPKTHRQGVSGNPQRRAQQLQERRAQGKPAFGQLPREPPADPDRAAFRELAYRLAGGAPAEPWWRESHERILTRARALTWPSRLVDLETQACQIVGDEFCDRLQSPGTGLHPAQWLRALAEETGAVLRAEIAQGADDWQKLWALLCGLALTAPRTPAGAVSKTVLSVREEFPGIKDPLQTALAEAGKVAGLLANRGLAPGAGRPAGGSPVGRGTPGCPGRVRQPAGAHGPVQLRRGRTGSLVRLGHRLVLDRCRPARRG